MSALSSSSAAVAEAARRLQRSEKVARLDIMRRQLRESIQINDNLMEDADLELAAVAHLKREWQLQQAQTDADRRALAGLEASARGDLERDCLAWFDSTYTNDFAPAVKKSKKLVLPPAHRRR